MLMVLRYGSSSTRTYSLLSECDEGHQGADNQHRYSILPCELEQAADDEGQYPPYEDPCDWDPDDDLLSHRVLLYS